MEANRDLARAAGDQVGLSWEVAGEIASRWLVADDSTFEASVFTRGAIRLVQAVIYELSFSPGHHSAAVSACRQFLAEEETAPGSVIARLQSSKAPEVVSVAKAVESRGKGWAVTDAPQRNVIVLTALMNLPESE